MSVLGSAPRGKSSGAWFGVRSFFQGLRTQIITGITIVTIAAIALLGFLSIKIIEWNALFQKGKQAEVVVTFVQTVLTKEQQGEGFNSLRDFITGISHKGVIKNMVIVDDAGKMIFSTGEGISIGKGKGRQIFSFDGLNIEMAGGGWFKGIGKELVISAPIPQGPVTGGLKRGTIQFSMPLSDIREEGARFRKFIFFYALVDSFIIIAFGAYLFLKGIIRPIQILKRVAEDIAGGNLEKRVKIDSPEEIKGFASSFNTMADKLEEKITLLERLNRELIIAQEELIRSEKLATVGRLAAGVAHEIGNPLGAILGYVDIMKKGVSKDEETDILERLGNEITRIHTTVRGLLDFSRPSKGASHRIDVNKVVNDSAAMLLPQLSAKAISLDMQLSEHLPFVVMDEGMLQQVLFNLFLNANDAIEKDGVIRVETSEFIAPEHIERMRVRKGDAPISDAPVLRMKEKERKCVKISVADTGKGIPEEDIGKIFDPFFTTKEKGTGLGLPVSLSIVQAYGGDIRVKSQIGKGTTFEVILPVEEKKK